MFDDKDRKELLRILDIEYAEARNLLLKEEALPSSMSHNSETVGVSIVFRKLRRPAVKERGVR